jgi:hypothetical protein
VTENRRAGEKQRQQTAPPRARGKGVDGDETAQISRT